MSPVLIDAPRVSIVDAFTVNLLGDIDLAPLPDSGAGSLLLVLNTILP